MTREEIIQAISDDKMMPFIQPDQLAEIVEFVIKNYKPSLPSDLDEAAEKYTNDSLNNLGAILRVNVSNAFKAGAEWMAGQYEKIEGELVDWFSTSDGKDYCCGVKTIDSFEVPEGFYIRKKQ